MAQAGRPTKYNDDMCRIALEVFSKGKSIRNVAATLGIDKTTLYRWKEENPIFRATIEQGVDLALKYLEDKLLDIVENPELKTHPDYFRAIHLALKTRFHEVYGDKQEIKLEASPQKLIIEGLDE